MIITDNSQVAPNTISGHSPPAGDHANIIAGSIDGPDLAVGAVSGGRLANNSVSTGKIVNGDVRTNNLMYAEACRQGGQIMDEAIRNSRSWNAYREEALKQAGVTYLYLGKELGGRPDGAEFYDAEGHVLYYRVAEAPWFQDGIKRHQALRSMGTRHHPRGHVTGPVPRAQR